MVENGNSYELVAHEYYDAVKHPTCDNFREASKSILYPWLESEKGKNRICDVGAGRSLVAEFYIDQDRQPLQLLLLDSSATMLGYSAVLHAVMLHLVLGDATQLPYRDECLDLVVSSLGDPYNVPALWEEIHRVLRPGGKAMFTTPSHAWSSEFRRDTRSHEHDAEFVIDGGTAICLPSFILPNEQQVRLIETAGLMVVDVVSSSISGLRSNTISSKLGDAPDGLIVTGYRAVRPPASRATLT